MKKYLILLILLSFSLLSGCGATNHADAEHAALTMKTYTVPAGRAQDLAHTLRIVFSVGKDQADVGNAWVAGPGQILVLAPAGMQDSIAKSIRVIVANDNTAAKPQPLRLNAWLVDAYPGKGANDPVLKTIQPALNAFAAEMGTSHFAAGHYLTSVSDAGQLAQVSPTPGESLEYKVTPTGNGVVLDFNYRDRGAHLNGKVTSKLGQNLVLGLVSERPDGKGPGSIHRLLVIRIVPADQG